MDRVFAVALDVQPCQSCLQMPRAENVGATELRWCDPVDAATTGSCAERRRFLAEEFTGARRSALVELELVSQETTWLGVDDIRETSR